YCEQI
ncbi:hypothetical protein CFOL_v3_19865, partial [Cephalotus follicularis]